MHVPFARGAVRSAALAAAVTSALAWAPAATAQPSEPTASASSAAAKTPTPNAGSIMLTTKDTAGDILPGAAFVLLDATGQESGRGTTDTQGALAFPDLAPGVYRLKETASGSPLHQTVADQDIIVTPGETARLTITNPLKAAQVLFQAKDDKTGKLLPGSTVNIGTGSETLLTLTTGPQGTATGELSLTRHKATFWVKQVTAPTGYDLYKTAQTFIATPGALLTVTVSNSQHTTATTPGPSDKPTAKPTTALSAPVHKPTATPSGSPSPALAGTATPGTEPSLAPAAVTAAVAPAKAPTGSLAHTGANATGWLLGAGGILVAVGGGAILAPCRRKTAGSACPDQGDAS